ncbi:hypothetical protein DD238_007056 [Peronospora effusa]|uniref:Uncharacterized protein n=1 Tax=Peronospora effusa TaxID=542832 RepID=A0A3M6VDH6_9STRA|nr:hypothetical protein DD238_007056 [Peronospora effusa]
MSVLVQALRQKMKKMASLREHGFYYVNGLVAMFYFANRSSKVTYSSSEHRAAIGKVDEDNTMKRSSPASIRNEIGSSSRQFPTRTIVSMNVIDYHQVSIIVTTIVIIFSLSFKTSADLASHQQKELVSLIGPSRTIGLTWHNRFQLQKQSRMKIYYTKACCLKSARKDRMHHYRGRLETNLVMESLLILTY